MSSYMYISPERLIEIVDECLYNIQEQRKEFKWETRKRFNWKKLRYEEYQIKAYVYASWAATGIGTDKRLIDLKKIAQCIIEDGKVEDRDIKLSETSYRELMKCYNKDSRFEPYIFAYGY